MPPSTEPIESLLRQSLAAEPPPTLSPHFPQTFEQRLQPRRLGKKQRRFLVAYSFAGLLLSVGALRSAGFSWGLTLLCVLAPLALITIALRPYLRKN